MPCLGVPRRTIAKVLQRGIKEWESELEQIKKDKEPLAVTLTHFEVAFNNAKKKLDQVELKTLAHVGELEDMEQEQKDICA